MMRHLSFIDKVINEVDVALKTVFKHDTQHKMPNPADKVAQKELLTKDEARLSANLMRIDHTGEICAQALYRGQAYVAKTETTRNHLLKAADEELDHLAWCEHRLQELNDRTSYLNPFWYTGSFILGAAAGIISDNLSLGYIMETENQVMAHLENHLERIPTNDKKSQAILKKMYADEKKHANDARKAGGIELPKPLKLMMKAQSKVMTNTVYYI